MRDGRVLRIAREHVYPGRAAATQEVNISFEVSGRLLDRQVDVGGRVKAGDILAVLDREKFETALKTAKAAQSAAEGQVENAEKQLERQEKLLEEGFSTQEKVDVLVALLRTARGQLDAAKAAVERAEIDLSHTTVTAPFDGTVSETFAENFQNVLAKERILRLLDTSQIEMTVHVPEALIGLAPYVENIVVTFKTLPDVEIPAKIKEISTEASLTTRTYPVTLVMDQPQDAEIKPGMAGEARAVVELPEDWVQKGIIIPASAVFSPDDAKTDEVFVWVVDAAESVVQRRPVNVITTSARGVLVKGVEPNERIVVAGVSFLADGQQIRLLAE